MVFLGWFRQQLWKKKLPRIFKKLRRHAGSVSAILALVYFLGIASNAYGVSGKTKKMMQAFYAKYPRESVQVSQLPTQEKQRFVKDARAILLSLLKDVQSELGRGDFERASESFRAAIEFAEISRMPELKKTVERNYQQLRSDLRKAALEYFKKAERALQKGKIGEAARYISDGIRVAEWGDLKEIREKLVSLQKVLDEEAQEIAKQVVIKKDSAGSYIFRAPRLSSSLSSHLRACYFKGKGEDFVYQGKTVLTKKEINKLLEKVRGLSKSSALFFLKNDAKLLIIKKMEGGQLELPSLGK